MANTRANIKRSLDKYVHRRIYEMDGLNVDFTGVPFDNTNYSEWVQFRIELNEWDFVRQASTTEYGSNLEITIEFIIYCKKSSLTTSDRHYRIRDIIMKHF